MGKVHLRLNEKRSDKQKTQSLCPQVASSLGNIHCQVVITKNKAGQRDTEGRPLWGTDMSRDLKEEMSSG